MSADLGVLIQPLQPYAQALVDLGGRAGVQPRITSTARSRSQQQRLYDAFVRGESKYPVAPPGRSAHEFGYAFDMVASTAENLHDLGAVWRSWGGVWSTADEVHFEFPGFNPDTATPVNLPFESRCDLTNWRSYVLWNPYCACRVVDLIKAPLIASLVEMGWPNSEVVKLFAHPCGELLDIIDRLGL